VSRVTILGIDPGTTDLGYGVIADAGGRLRPLVHGTVRTAPGEPLERRLALIFARVRELLEAHAVQEVALEDLYVGGNPRTVLSVGHARGAVLAACGLAGVPARGYAPAQVKGAVCGFGRASKAQVQRMVTAILSLDRGPPGEHAADALAVAICHAQRSRPSPLSLLGGRG
jgi:crossover junction endodeoxyribonuclease RuvC